MIYPGASEAELQKDLERGRRLVRMRELGNAIAVELGWQAIETHHYMVALDGVAWHDLRMQRMSSLKVKDQIERVLEFLELRGCLERHAVFPNLVRLRAEGAGA